MKSIIIVDDKTLKCFKSLSHCKRSLESQQPYKTGIL